MSRHNALYFVFNEVGVLYEFGKIIFHTSAVKRYVKLIIVYFAYSVLESIVEIKTPERYIWIYERIKNTCGKPRLKK